MRRALIGVVVVVALVGLGYAYNRELVAQLEIDELERIPVLAEEPVVGRGARDV